MLFILFSLLACGQKTIYTDMYQILSPEQNWKAVESGGADYAWYNKDLGGIIYVDSNCKRQFEDRPLRDSTISLLAGIATGTSISEYPILLDGREALMTIQKAKVDGIDVHIAAVVMSKNSCLYDFLYIAPPHRFNYGLNQFNDTIYSFQTKENVVLERKKEP